jgi:hypothetical protein
MNPPASYAGHSALQDKGAKNMATKSIPKDVKAKVIDIIDRFNRDVLADDYRTYIARFKGNYLFLYRDDGGYKPGPICRLRYTGDMTKWVFAIYRYSQTMAEQCSSADSQSRAISISFKEIKCP